MELSALVGPAAPEPPRVDSDQWWRRKRASERLSRQRRRDKACELQSRVALLERIALVLSIVGDDDAPWDEFLDDDCKRVRATLRQLASTSQAIKTLLTERNHLHRLLLEHQLATRVLRRLAAKQHVDSVADDWDTNLSRWQQQAHRHFRKWAQAECDDEVDAAVQEAYRFAYSRSKQTTGFTFMGWKDSRRLDAATSALQFSFEKCFFHYDLDRFVAMIRHSYMDSALFSRVVLGNSGKGAVHVLQEVSPSISLVLYRERYSGMPVDVYSASLVATVETDDGVTLYLRYINTPELMDTIGRRGDVWISKFYWLQFDILDQKKPRHACDFRLSLRGSLSGQDPTFLNVWLFEALGALLRSEAYASGRPLLTF